MAGVASVKIVMDASQELVELKGVHSAWLATFCKKVSVRLAASCLVVLSVTTLKNAQNALVLS